MKRLLDRILGFFNISGRDWVVLVLALLLAFSIWIIHNLSLKYNEYLKVSVSVSSSIDGFAPVSSNVCQVSARCRTTGYKIMLSKMRSGRKVVNISIPGTEFTYKGGDEFHIFSDALYEYSQQIFGSGVTVDHFVSDTLIFHFSQENFKKVPVIPVYSVTYSQHYMNDGGIRITPDSVYVYGETFRLDNISSVRTMPIKHYDLQSDVRAEVPLKKINGVRISEKKVEYSMRVLRFVGVNSVLSVTGKNLPAGKKIVTYPSVVKVKQRWRYPLSADYGEERYPFVDYNDFEHSISGMCKVQMGRIPDGMIDYDIEPPYVECKVIDK